MMGKKALRAMEILLVEDNPGDIRLAREAFGENQVAVNLHTVNDGVEAMEFLHREGSCDKAPHPDLIILDLNLPRKDGREVLSEIKTDDRLKTIPVIILTTSESEGDIHMAYYLGSNCYIAKPADLSQFIKIIKSIGDFWLNIVKLPRSK